MSEGLIDDIAVQLEQQGVASYKVGDGEVFMFTTAILEKMLEQSRAQGKVVVFVKTRPST